MDLFDYMRKNTIEQEAPLASRLRPSTLDEVVGQKHIIGKDKLLYRAIKADKLGSLIFYGPPGTAGRPLRPATDRRFGGPLPRQLPNQTRAHPIPPEFFTPSHAALCAYAVLAAVSSCYPPVWGRSPTRYSPVRRSVN